MNSLQKEITDASSRSSQVKVSLKMLECMEEKDINGLLLCLDENVVWENAPLPNFVRANNLEEVRKLLSFMLKGISRFQVGEIISLVEEGDRVIMERTEILTMLGFELHVVGVSVLVFRNEKVIEWRDYFDVISLTFRFLISLPKQIFRKVIKLFSE